LGLSFPALGIALSCAAGFLQQGNNNQAASRVKTGRRIFRRAFQVKALDLKPLDIRHVICPVARSGF
jgi:hypothetical protein